MAENPLDSIETDLAARFDLLGAQMADQVREWISVDVERTEHGVIRSQPGEHPRRDTHVLYDSIQDDTKTADHVITVTIDTDVPYAPKLQEQMDRPIVDGLIEQFEAEALEIAAQVIAGE